MTTTGRWTKCIGLVGLVASCAFVAAATDVPIPGRISIVKFQNLTKFVSKSPAPLALPVAGSADDPTLYGAELRFFDEHPFGGGDVSFSLDATGWTGLGNPPGSKGYAYRGESDVTDPDPQGTCRLVLLKQNAVKAVCKGATVSLETPFVAAESIVLGIPAVSSASLRYCAEFGGTEKKNDATVLKRSNAAAPVACVDEQNAKCGEPAFGECPAPSFCAQFPRFGPWGCVFEFCGGTFPTCGGTCGVSGWECKPVRTVSTSGQICLCSPPPSSPIPGIACGSQCNGFGCPAGMVCEMGIGGCGCAAL